MLLNKLPPGVCWRGGGGGGGGATGLLNKGGGASKQQAVEFPQVLTSIILLTQISLTITIYALALKDPGHVLLSSSYEILPVHMHWCMHVRRYTCLHMMVIQ